MKSPSSTSSASDGSATALHLAGRRTSSRVKKIDRVEMIEPNDPQALSTAGDALFRLEPQLPPTNALKTQQISHNTKKRRTTQKMKLHTIMEI
ncbi:hypothetical protein KSP39_PZI020088 [Platanthera zijinensis]|uniref:Uncharacterized protein n=1 Tax=Platanthera zijinensis TaxID=2320716 RepID=A0AAP0B0R6_9ASPA